MAGGSGMPEDPWTLNTPLGKAEFQMHRDEEKQVLHCQVPSLPTYVRHGARKELE